MIAAVLPEGAGEIMKRLGAVDTTEWFSAPLTKKGKKLKGDTAGGQAAEKKLNIPVNNRRGPDLEEGRVEVKAGRINSTCPTTLLTKAPCFPEGANRMLVTEHGYACTKRAGVTRLMVSLSAAQPTTARNGIVFSLRPDESRLNILANNVVVAGYERDEVVRRGEAKFGGILAFIEMDSRLTEDDHEEFRIAGATLHWGYDDKAFWAGISDGRIVVEPRLKKTGNTVRDRGTAFRCENPSFLYANTLRVL